MTRSERWILSEWTVAKDRAQRCGEELVAHRLRTPYAEIDLLFYSTASSHNSFFRGYTLVEVKSWGQRDVWGPAVISPSQVARLERARWYIEEKYQAPVRLHLAVVMDPRKGGEIQYFDRLF